MSAASLRTPGGSFEADPEAVYAFVGRFFAGLAAVGVEHVVISPGSRSTPLSVVARQTPGLRTWIELDERAAAFFALGLAKESGQPAALVCTSGTAAANYLPAVVEAHYSRVPMLLLTADRPPELRDWGAGQTIDQSGLYGRYARWAVELPVPEAGDEALRYADQLAARSVDVARAAPAGAVHLNWPLREPLAPGASGLAAAARAVAPDGDLAGPPRLHPRRAECDSDEVETLVGLAREHEQGVICCGPMSAAPELRRAIAAFGRQAGWPVLADPASNLRAPSEVESAPIVDTGDLLARTPRFSQRMRPEVVVRVGDSPVSKAQRLWLEAGDAREVVWVDRGGQWGEPSRRATRVLRSDAEGLFAASAASLAASPGEGADRLGSPWCRSFLAADRAARAAVDGGDPRAAGLAVAACVARSAPAGARLFASNSMSIRLLDLALSRPDAPLHVHCSRGASGIDGVTSTALGVAAAAAHGAAAGSSVPTLLLTGDLAFLHDLSGLLIAARESIPLTIVVLDDDGGGIFSFLPIAEQGESVDFEALFQTPHRVDLAAIAPALGIAVERFDLRAEGGAAPKSDLAAIETALERAVSRPEVSIVHVRIDAERNTAGFRETIAQAISAVEGVLGVGASAGAR